RQLSREPCLPFRDDLSVNFGGERRKGWRFQSSPLRLFHGGHPCFEQQSLTCVLHCEFDRDLRRRLRVVRRAHIRSLPFAFALSLLGMRVWIVASQSSCSREDGISD